MLNLAPRRHRNSPWLVGLLIVAGWCAVPERISLGQGPPASLVDSLSSPPDSKSSQPPPLPIQDHLEAEREENKRALRIAQKAAEAHTAAAAKEPTKASTREVELRTQLGYVLDQLQSATEREAQLLARSQELTEELTRLHANGPPEERPFTFTFVEQLRDELTAEKNRTESIQTVLTAARDARSRAQQDSQRRASARRKAKEALDTNKQEALTGSLDVAFQSAELEARVAEETARLRGVEFHAEELQQQLHKQRLTLLREKLAVVEAEVQFSRSDLQAQKLQIEKQQEDLKPALEWAQRRASDLDQRWAEASRTLEAQSQQDPALAAKAESYRIGRQVRGQEITLLTAQLERLARGATAWDRRFQVSNGSAVQAELVRWQADTEQLLEQLDREARLQVIRQDELRQDLATLEKKVQASAEAPPAMLEANQEQRMHLERLLRSYEANSASIEASRRLHEKLLRELVGDATQFNLGEWLGRAWRKLAEIWNFEITSVDERPITLGKIISGLILLLLGIVASRWLSKLFAERLLRRVGFNDNAISAWQSLAFYGLVATFALLALQMVNVPLGVLTFLGGAVAIGVGFGSQNILNNFISGLILLAERPVRVGDVIQIDGLMGTVERIGGRSTRIRTGANLEIIIPNSTFLQNNVVNWTLADDRIQAKVSVGVAYGTVTRDVARLLRKAADDHGLILKTPEPLVYFSGFGDSSMNFELLFWIQMRTLGERLRIESDLRFMIDAAFREAGISIPYPQRDLHLAQDRPLDIRLMSPTSLELTGLGEQQRASA